MIFHIEYLRYLDKGQENDDGSHMLATTWNIL